eukprot:8215088-Alexandrium_andersonii.AAC.1
MLQAVGGARVEQKRCWPAPGWRWRSRWRTVVVNVGKQRVPIIVSVWVVQAINISRKVGPVQPLREEALDRDCGERWHGRFHPQVGTEGLERRCPIVQINRWRRLQ